MQLIRSYQHEPLLAARSSPSLWQPLMASPSGSDVALLEDEDLQRALALSLEEARSGGAAPREEATATQEVVPTVSPHAGRRQPMRGRRTIESKPIQQPHQAASAQQQQQQQQPAPKEPAAAARQQHQQHQHQQRPQQRHSPGAAKPTGVSKPSPSGASGRKPRGKKLPAYNPTDAEVEACYKLLAGGGSTATVGSLIEVRQGGGGRMLCLACPCCA